MNAVLVNVRVKEMNADVSVTTTTIVTMVNIVTSAWVPIDAWWMQHSRSDRVVQKMLNAVLTNVKVKSAFAETIMTARVRRSAKPRSLKRITASNIHGIFYRLTMLMKTTAGAACNHLYPHSLVRMLPRLTLPPEAQSVFHWAAQVCAQHPLKIRV